MPPLRLDPFGEILLDRVIDLGERFEALADGIFGRRCGFGPAGTDNSGRDGAQADEKRKEEIIASAERHSGLHLGPVYQSRFLYDRYRRGPCGVAAGSQARFHADRFSLHFAQPSGLVGDTYQEHGLAGVFQNVDDAVPADLRG